MYSKIKCVYQSDEDDLLNDFYIPALSSSIEYDRAVGYFSATTLSYAIQGLNEFVRKGGKMRLIIGEEVNDEEYELIRSTSLSGSVEDTLFEKWEEIFENAAKNKISQKLNILSWMILNNRLSIKYAIRRIGMYHEKIGVMSNSDETIVFHGSMNETVYGVVSGYNVENISVYFSSDKAVYERYGKPYIEKFERLWRNEVGSTLVVDLPSKQYDLIRKNYKKENSIYEDLNNPYDVLEAENLLLPQMPKYLGVHKYKPHEHQIKSLESWRKNNFNGIMALATGSGKTVTAIHGFVSIFKQVSESSKLVLIVSVPYRVIGDQWCDVLRLFNIDALKCYNSKQLWYPKAVKAVSDFKILDSKKYLAFVVVNKTMVKKEFQEILSDINQDLIYFVGDECHHHGSIDIINKLPRAKFRLGLSATPWSSKEVDRKVILQDYYDDIVSKYTIDEAIENKILTPYDYFIHTVNLEEIEFNEYENLSSRLNKLIAIRENNGYVDESLILSLNMARARIIGSMNDKLSALEKIIRKNKVEPYTLFYCGDGSVEDDDTEGSVRDIHRYSSLLHKHGVNVSQFTAEESYTARNKILSSFAKKSIDGLVAIRVLDEGFDVPACKTAFLFASSRNERQFIQRRGRILRKHDNKDKAVIHDFIVLPPEGNCSAISVDLVRKEMARVVEFVRICHNKDIARAVALEISERYSIDYESVENDNLEWSLDGF